MTSTFILTLRTNLELDLAPNVRGTAWWNHCQDDGFPFATYVLSGSFIPAKLIAEQKLKRMTPRWQRDLGLTPCGPDVLTRETMSMIITSDRRIEHPNTLNPKKGD